MGQEDTPKSLPESELQERWVTVERPGYSGGMRDQRIADWNGKYGEGNWRQAWHVDGQELDFLGICRHYEDAYVEYLKNHQDVLEELASEASEVYDDSPSNTGSGLDYSLQETRHTHIQDIAIRNSLKRLGRKFKGQKMVQIRDEVGEHRLSMTLSPGRIPFHRQDWIIQPELEGWWEKGTVEAFYQSTKVLQVKEVVVSDS